jgi:hypothetical protein
MPRKHAKEPRPIGRPPAGAREGEKVKDYPQLSIRLPIDVKAKLHALSVISGMPQWRLISQAVECYLRERTETEQRLVSEIAPAAARPAAIAQAALISGVTA